LENCRLSVELAGIANQFGCFNYLIKLVIAKYLKFKFSIHSQP
jgi:hypothetical protein